MILLDPHSFVPLYHQLAQILREQIHSGKFTSGAELPSERELMQQYQISRNTVRQALDLLDREGLIKRTLGSGTRVSSFPSTFQYHLDTFYENRDLLLRAGFTPTVRLVSTLLLLPPEVARTALALPQGQMVTVKTMIFHADDRPAMYTQDFLPFEVKEEYDLSPQGPGFMKYLDAQTDRHVDYVTVDLASVEAVGEVAATFKCAPGAPVLLMKETFLDESQQNPIAFSMNYFNNQLMDFRLLMRRG
ncbi:MAG: GntR family transcriptional regulator [Anaerolineaceae bacterium]|nr:GntR family transcriptional regulator [Anaerolineaceae bacterium]